MKTSQTILRNLDIALGALALVFLGLYACTSVSSGESESPESFGDPRVIPASEESLTNENMMKDPMNADEEIPRYVIDRHTVVGGESFSLITGHYWDDMFLWPDLYIRNDMRSDDPDLIYPNEIVNIYNRLGQGDSFTSKEKELVLEAYIEVYDRFKALGAEKNDSAWTLLWCGAKYDHDFLKKYADRIDPEDLKVVQRYIDEEDYLD